MKKLFVGNLDIRVIEEELRELLVMHGQVNEVNIVRDTYSGRSRRFAFIAMSRSEEAEQAIAALNGAKHRGRILTVVKAHEPNRVSMLFSSS